jgi:beta-barrel assembly-enhancing protease
MRQSEEEADLLGVQYLYRAGYDPTAMVSMFQKLTADEIAGRVSELFDTHLPTEPRVTKANENIKRYLPRHQQNIVTAAEFQTVKARVIAPIQ